MRAEQGTGKMVHSKQSADVQSEAIRAAFRKCDISGALTPRLEALLKALDFVNIETSSIRCQGLCKNGGRCSQQIAKTLIVRSLMRLETWAVDDSVTGGELQCVLGEDVYKKVLCGSAKHCTQEQIERCAKKAKRVVEAWREQWIGVPGVKQEEASEEDSDRGRDCKDCVALQEELDDANERADAATDELRLQYRLVATLMAERDDALQRLQRYRQKHERARKECDASENRAEDLARQLKTLQLKYDSLLGRMASEVEEGQRFKSPSAAPGSSAKTAVASESKGAGAGTERLRSNTAAAAADQDQPQRSKTPSLPSPKYSLRSLAKAASNMTTGTPFTRLQAQPPNSFKPVSGDGALGIDNPKTRKPFDFSSSPLTPDPTPSHLQLPQSANILLSPGAVQAPSVFGPKGQRGPAVPVKHDTGADDDSVSPFSTSANPWAADLGTGRSGEKPKAPYGFTVRKH